MPRICIHGHFYQPPREDPWTGEIRPQPSARPFQDWNQRITAECYRANAQARVLDAAGRVAVRKRTYDYVSFNFGPTLMRWMSRHAPDVLDSLVDADHHSLLRLGHGNALAQAYHHAILPLANDRDRRTEVAWGAADFAHRLGRRPEGMWLPETAVDTATLEVLADAGVAFVILAPRQCAAVRGPGSTDWTAVDERTVDPSRPYRVALSGGRSIDAFFYDSAPAHGVAFAGWLDDGEAMAHRLAASTRDFVHFATDGESYGHHHRYGEMALAFCVRTLLRRDDVELTNYAAELARAPVAWEARVVEGSSWSCAHGVGRWSDNCGCAIDPGRSGDQEWRIHLRAALNWLRDALADDSERLARGHGEDLWELRDRYVFHLLAEESGHPVPGDPIPREWTKNADSRRLRDLLELQRHALMMFTSCGWFFDDPGRVEPVQILRYAHRAVHLHAGLTGRSLEAGFLDRLQPVRSPDEGLLDGRQLYAAKVAAVAPV